MAGEGHAARPGWRSRPEAIETNSRILELAPGDVAALNRRGRCYFERGDLEVLDREPANSYALMGLGRALYNLDLPDQAVETFERAAKFAERRETVRDAVAELERMRETYQGRGEADRAEWISSVLDRLRVR